MIGRLTGRVVEEDADGTVVLDVNGVGYEVLVPAGSLGRLRAETPDGPITMFVHTHVREDVFALFGFPTAADRAAFRTLIGVSGVGPRTAVAVLAALPAGELGQAIARKEIARLTSIAGIGKKTAERLLLELRDKLPLGSAASPTNVPATTGGVAATSGPSGRPRDLLAQALVRMGYRAVEHLGDKVETAALGELVREALLYLSK